jgi:hypothetical protein
LESDETSVTFALWLLENFFAIEIPALLNRASI